MKQERISTLSSEQSMFETDSSRSHLRQGGSLGSNSSDQHRIQFLMDVQCWLDSQAAVLRNISPIDRQERVNGVLDVLVNASEAFRFGELVDVSCFPLAPTSTEAPFTTGLVPGIQGLMTAFFVLMNAPKPETLQASAAGVVSDKSGAATGQTIVSRDGIAELASRILSLRLKLPNERRSFSVRELGDRESVTTILQHCREVGIRSPDQVAYILATAWHESRMGSWMTESGWLSERSAERYAEREYGPNGKTPARARRMGNTNAGDGGRYMGRGYVQLTWKNNYARMSRILMQNKFTYTQDGVTYGDGSNGTKPIDLVANYKHVNRNKDLAARILVLGMDGGHYVGDNKGLDSYLPEDKEASQDNFEQARRIVNGSDKKKLIAQNAITIAGVLRNKNAWGKLAPAIL